MFKPAVDLYNTLLEEAIDCNTIKGFKHLAEMTTAHAERRIISLLKSGTLYVYNGRFIIKHFDRLCIISLNKKSTLPSVGAYSWAIGDKVINDYDEPEPKETVRIDLPFSPKHLCGGRCKCTEPYPYVFRGIKIK